MALPPDLIELLREFAAGDVRYLLIGGHALAFHGAPRFTKDVDFWIKSDPDNLARIDLALRRFGAPEATLPAIAALSGLDVAWMGNPPLRFDFMVEVPGGNFDLVYPRKLTTRWEGAPVTVIGADDLLLLAVHEDEHVLTSLGILHGLREALERRLQDLADPLLFLGEVDGVQVPRDAEDLGLVLDQGPADLVKRAFRHEGIGVVPRGLDPGRHGQPFGPRDTVRACANLALCSTCSSPPLSRWRQAAGPAEGAARRARGSA